MFPKRLSEELWPFPPQIKKVRFCWVTSSSSYDLNLIMSVHPAFLYSRDDSVDDIKKHNCKLKLKSLSVWLEDKKYCYVKNEEAYKVLLRDFF